MPDYRTSSLNSKVRLFLSVGWLVFLAVYEIEVLSVTDFNVTM